ncbi:MAG TPA: hypothetical protein VJV78_25655, partial [Polyangiales bacterium]|nr:hypothetical protein [Polyangiales bacterium]
GGAAAPHPDTGGDSDDAGVTSQAGAGGTPAAGSGGAPATRTDLDTVLCDGMPGITFAAVMTLGGQPNIGSPMMAENGYRYLLVEGTCRFWIQAGRLERVRTGQLSPAQLQRLREAFQMQRWQQLVGNYPALGFDTPGYFYALGRGKLSESCGRWGDAGGCIQFGMGSPVMVGENFSWLHSAFLQVSNELAGSGAPAMGDVRYMLVEGMATIVEPSAWSNPSTWPLGDAKAVAMSETEASQVYVPGSGRLARGADADKLHEAWRAFLSYEKTGRTPDMPASGSLAIPIVAGGARYQLFIRDSIPLEDARGLIAF